MPFSSSVGKKLGMAVTGIFLYGFLLAHLTGNLLLLGDGGGATFNAYAEFLTSHPLLIPAELGLIALFVLHLYLAITVSLENRRARPTGYQVTRTSGSRSWASRTMIWSGLAIVVFLVVHITGFKYGDRGDGTLYDLVADSFRSPLYAGGYLIAMLVLGFHLWHAFHSAFQTLGLSARPKLRKLSIALCALLAGGFALIPVWFLLSV
ncbi:succinate dehydrogenase cytochrome b subunit [Candidatus Latescibacterota bacterium]